jgi:hypothetical protein
MMGSTTKIKMRRAMPSTIWNQRTAADPFLFYLVKLPYTALADQKHGRRQCLRAWVGPQHAQKAKFLNLQFEDRGKIKLTTTFPGISSN